MKALNIGGALAVAVLGATILSMADSKKQSSVPIVFTERAREAGIDFILKNHATPEKRQIEAMPGGVAVIDYNNDGFEDLYFTNGAAIPRLAKIDQSYWNRLYRNNGDGTFTDVTLKAGVKGEGYSMGVAAGDFDNDGWDDLFVAGVNRNILFRNNHDGTFSDVTLRAGLSGASHGKPWSISAGWFDYDNDGWLDLFVVNYCKWELDKDPYCGERKPGYRTYCDPRRYEGLQHAVSQQQGRHVHRRLRSFRHRRAHWKRNGRGLRRLRRRRPDGRACDE